MKFLKENLKNQKFFDLLFAVVLLLYPLRHIRWGLDLWDTGYNYANFAYMGVEHMDPMWLFSTFLANVAGHLLMKLPGAGSLLGMNFYTSLIVGVTAAGSYFFCIGKLKMPRWVAFVGEMLALGLCWCPSAALYHYLTYILFSVSVILLYVGLTEERKWWLFAAGVCLGCNVLVRFSNLPQAAMIIAVWAWDFSLWREKGKAVKDREDGEQPSFWRLLFRHTLWCLGGYLAALAVLFGFIQVRYGMGNYIEGIRRLFAMTGDATDYKATSMVIKMWQSYEAMLFWISRMGIVLLVGVAGFLLLGWIRHWRQGEGETENFASGRGWRVLWRLAQIGWCAVSVLLFVWMYRNHGFSFVYTSYDSIYALSVLFLMLTMFIAAVRIFYPGSPKEEKLISGMLILLVLVTSIGGNNGVYPSINNLFVAGPYTLWQCWRFIRHVGDWKGKGRLPAVSVFPVKAVLGVFLAVLLVQSGLFGLNFVFVEATGGTNITDVIENNEILRGIKMSPERARWMEEISGFVNENGLQGREVILYGQIPALSYYLQMPAAFNPWSDLDSYGYEVMKAALDRLAGEMTEKGRERPVIILNRGYVRQQGEVREDGEVSLRGQETGEGMSERVKKYYLIVEFAEEFNYDLTFSNEKFLVYE